ncbi:MAG TPA: ParB N-terminal domain-containing protein, partial [bacterium]|nr:ParB N-terminal domain-containing protein [bacterium]
METTTPLVKKVEIQDVLTALPQIFPGTQDIPLNRIRPNPDNPGFPAAEQEIDELATNIREVGLLNPIKVRPDWDKPFGEGVAPHPDNPRLKGDGSPWKVGDFNWVNLSGESRAKAFAKLGRETIPGYILNPTHEEAVIITGTDNKVRYRGDWWPDYQLVESLVEANPNLTQEQVAVKLKLNEETVNWAIRLLPLLNSEARGLIVGRTGNSTGEGNAIPRNPRNSNKGIRGISASAAFQLTGLGPESPFKPGVKREGDDSQKLWPYPFILPETQDLVLRALKVAMAQGMTEAGVKNYVAWIKQGHQPEDYQAQGGTGRQAQNGAGQPPGISANNIQGTSPALKAGGVAGLLTALFQPRLKAAGQAVSGLGGWIKTFFLQNFKRAMGTMVRKWMYHGLVGIGVILLISPHLFSSLYHLVFGYGSPKSKISQSAISPSTAIPQGLRDQVDDDSQRALHFAGDFYTPDYHDTDTWMQFMSYVLAPGYSDAFFKA